MDTDNKMLLTPHTPEGPGDKKAHMSGPMHAKEKIKKCKIHVRQRGREQKQIVVGERKTEKMI